MGIRSFEFLLLQLSRHKRSSDGPSNDRGLWRETLSNGNSKLPVCWFQTQAPRVECSDGILYDTLLYTDIQCVISATVIPEYFVCILLSYFFV